MKYLKTLFLFLLTALAPTAWAQGVPPMGGSSSDTTFPAEITLYTCSAGYKDGYAGLSYADKTSLLQNEALKILFVTLNAGYSASSLDQKTPSELFEVDAFGNLSLTETGKTYIKECAWSDVARATEQASFGSSYGASGKLWRFIASYSFDSTTATAAAAYVFAFDSRAFDVTLGDYSVDPTFPCIKAWNAVKVADFNFEGISMGGGNVKSVSLDVALSGTTMSLYPTPTLATILPQSLVVGEETLSGTALEAYLAPAVEGLASNEDGFTLTGSSNDVLTYTLQTKASLDDEWDNFDAVLADLSGNLSENEKKVLESSSEKCYTCLRVKKSTQIKIPRLPNETQRFYRLKAE